MVRSGPSVADRELLGELAARGVRVSPAQLERWRAHGLIPRNERHGRGRGPGATSTVRTGALEAAEALARRTRQGRDVRLAVVDWFADAGRPALNKVPVPEPPDDAVRSALTWVLEGDPFYSLVRRARSAKTDEDRDEVYRVIDDFVEKHGAMERPLNPGLVRSALLSGDDLPDGVETPNELRSATIQLTAATALGADEIGTDLYVAVFARLFSSETISVESLSELFESPSTSTNSRAAMCAIATHDPLETLRRATADELRQAREAADVLNGCGAIYLFHALQLPDTPGLARLRAAIDALGMRDLLIMRATHAVRTRGYVTGVVSCLDDSLANLSEYLIRLVKEGPPLMGRPDTEQNAHAYMAEWIAAIEQLRRA